MSQHVSVVDGRKQEKELLLRQIEQGISPFSLQAAFPRHAIDAREGSDSALISFFYCFFKYHGQPRIKLRMKRFSDFRLGRNGAQTIPENFFNDFGSKARVGKS